MDYHGRRNVAVWLYVVACLLHLFKVYSQDTSLVNVTFIKNAQAKGAVCLDGSPGAFYFSRGFGDGTHKWIIFLSGGGWCTDLSSCLDRSKKGLGSTTGARPISLITILSANQDANPDFYNWNKVKAVYCDGASFMADVEAVDPETNLHLRGGRIFSSIMEELITTQGMDRATDALLAGDSAGGLATILNCDRFHSYFPSTSRVKCFSDSGFFIQAKEIPGAAFREHYYAHVVEFHGLARFLPESCTSRMAPSLCLFSENVVGDVQTPLFLLNSDVDQYQISKNLKPNPPDKQGWDNCTKNFNTLQNCTTSQIKLIIDFQMAFLETLKGLDDNPSRGLFINSCFIHDFIYSNWQGPPTLQNLTIAQALGDWYLERTNVKLIDFRHRPYPLNCTAAQQNCKLLKYLLLILH